MKKTIRWALATFLMFLLFHFNTFTTIPAINLNGIDAKLTTVLTHAKGCREQECCPANNTI
jgi:hypothetical protein